MWVLQLHEEKNGWKIISSTSTKVQVWLFPRPGPANATIVIVSMFLAKSQWPVQGATGSIEV